MEKEQGTIFPWVMKAEDQSPWRGLELSLPLGVDYLLRMKRMKKKGSQFKTWKDSALMTAHQQTAELSKSKRKPLSD